MTREGCEVGESIAKMDSDEAKAAWAKASTEEEAIFCYKDITGEKDKQERCWVRREEG